MYCTSCGKELDAGARFCTHCGSPVGETDIAEENIQATQILQSPEPEQTDEAAPVVSATTTPGLGVVQESVVAQEPTTALESAAEQELAAVQETAVVQDSADAQESAAVQQPAEKKGSKKTAVLIAIIVVLATLLAALLAFTMCSNQQATNTSSQDAPGSSEQPSSTSSSATSTSTAADASSSQADEPEEAGEALSPEEAAIKSLDGWWAGWYHRPGYYAAYGNIHDKVIDWYFYNPDKDAVEYSNTVDIVRADQFDENGAKGWRFFPSTATNEDFAYYQAEGDEDNLPIYKTAFGYGNIDTQNDNTDAVERFGITRITNPATLDEDGIHSQKGFEQAQALAKERGAEAGSSSSASTASSSSASLPSTTAGFDQAKAEADARAAAEAAGKQIFTGAVRVTTYAERAHERSSFLRDFDNNHNQLVLMEFTDAVDTSAVSGDGAKHGAIVNGQSDSFRLPDWFASYDGQTITIAVSENEMNTFSDTTGVLMSVNVSSAEVIAPLTEEDAKAKEAANSPDAYVLADSATKAYSRSELEALDNHTLFLARNEIYARHGRGFKNQELRDYFAGKVWYKETASPESFNDNVLNETEKANANLMLEIEKSRNSPYLG